MKWIILLCGIAEWGWKVVVFWEDDWEHGIGMRFAVHDVLEIYVFGPNSCFFCY